MEQGNKKVFNDKEKLYRMVNLRINGFATNSLAVIFNVDRDSIEKQLEKYRIKPKTNPDPWYPKRKEVFNIERIVLQALPKPEYSQWYIVDGQRFNKGKNYVDYIKDSVKYPHRSFIK